MRQEKHKNKLSIKGKEYHIQNEIKREKKRDRNRETINRCYNN